MNELSALLVQLKHECSFESFFVISVHHISRQIYTAIMYVEETFPIVKTRCGRAVRLPYRFRF